MRRAIDFKWPDINNMINYQCRFKLKNEERLSRMKINATKP
jgi:hypothetical protein